MNRFPGSLYERDLPDGGYIVVYRMLYNDRICYGFNEMTHERAFCFPQDGSAITAAESWDGHGDPPGPWIKETGTDRYGPGRKEKV